MNKYLILISLLSIGCISATSQDFILKASGGVYDFFVEDNLLYAATDVGIVDIFNLKSKKKIDIIKIPKIKDFTGELIPPKVFSIDKILGKKGILLTTQGEKGYRDIYYFDEKLTKIFDSEKDKLIAKRAKFINKELIIIGLLSNELILYNIKTKKQIYRKHLSTSVFSDFTTDSTRKLTITCEESGKIRILNSFSGKVIKVFSGENLDNLYKVCYNKLTFIGAGQDRRVSIYRWGKESFHIQTEFPVYCVGMDNEAEIAAYSADEDNDIYVFNIKTREIIYKLKGQKSTQTKIYFNNNQLISSSEDEMIMVWKLK